jgi:hypothetical protein
MKWIISVIVVGFIGIGAWAFLRAPEQIHVYETVESAPSVADKVELRPFSTSSAQKDNKVNDHEDDEVNLTDEQVGMINVFQDKYEARQEEKNLSGKKQLIEEMAKTSLGKTFFLQSIISQEFMLYLASIDNGSVEHYRSLLDLLDEKQKKEVYETTLEITTPDTDPKRIQELDRIFGIDKN